jgi:uncharacterized membrane protein
MTARRAAQSAAVVLDLGLIAMLLAWCGTLPGALLSLPLALPLPGLLRGRSYTAGWASMLLVFYAGGLLAEGVAHPERRLAGTGIAAIAALEFVALLLLVRFTARERAIRNARTADSAVVPH